MVFIEVKSLAGVNFIRAADIIAVQYSDREKCNVLLSGGISLPCVEAASVVAERVTAAVEGRLNAPAPQAIKQENADGDAGS